MAWLIDCILRDARSTPPCIPTTWHVSLYVKRYTIIGIGGIEYIEIGIVDGGGESLQSHLIAIWTGEAFAVEGGLGDVEKGVDQ